MEKKKKRRLAWVCLAVFFLAMALIYLNADRNASGEAGLNSAVMLHYADGTTKTDSTGAVMSFVDDEGGEVVGISVAFYGQIQSDDGVAISPEDYHVLYRFEVYDGTEQLFTEPRNLNADSTPFSGYKVFQNSAYYWRLSQEMEAGGTPLFIERGEDTFDVLLHDPQNMGNDARKVTVKNRNDVYGFYFDVAEYVTECEQGGIQDGDEKTFLAHMYVLVMDKESNTVLDEGESVVGVKLTYVGETGTVSLTLTLYSNDTGLNI